MRLLDNATKAKLDDLLNDEEVRTILNKIKKYDVDTLKEQLYMTEIPAPPFKEETRGKYLLERFKELALNDVRMDTAGNVIGVRSGTLKNSNIIISAHMDTVFKAGTDTVVKHADGKYFAPGIFDNTRGLAELLTLIRGMQESNIETISNVIFVATVGEEGLGDLRGVKHLLEELDDVRSFISIDGMEKENIIYGATSSKRLEVEFFTEGGHSYRKYGLPSAIHTMGRAVGKIADYAPLQDNKSTFTVGKVDGGTSVNSIASHARILIDIRSTSINDLRTMEEEIKNLIEEAVVEEQKRWNNTEVKSVMKIVGDRPGGVQKKSAPIVQITAYMNNHFGINSDFIDEGSTDSNLAIHKGIPAVTIGRGGTGAQTHTLQEWYENIDGYLAPQRAFLVLLALAGVEEKFDLIELEE